MKRSQCAFDDKRVLINQGSRSVSVVRLSRKPAEPFPRRTVCQTLELESAEVKAQSQSQAELPDPSLQPTPTSRLQTPQAVSVQRKPSFPNAKPEPQSHQPQTPQTALNLKLL